MYYPRRYWTLNRREGGKNGFLAPFEYYDIEQIVLYDLSIDICETSDVAEQYPEVVEKIMSLRDQIREELGDSLYKKEGKRQ